ncbi:MAG: hypothetical protein JNM06_07865, partial [Blastocatellia bacterium]|nr:hypothetical protein [Blastocatellia bacterium]
FYQLLAGCVPFEEEYSGIVGLVLMHLKQEPPSLRDFDPDIPQELEEIVMKTLIKDPEGRLSAAKLGQALRDFARSNSYTLSNNIISLERGHSSVNTGSSKLPTVEFSPKTTKEDKISDVVVS